MNIHPSANRAFILSLISTGFFLLAIFSFLAFLSIHEAITLILMLGFVAVSIIGSIVSLVFSSKGRKQIRLHSNEFTGAGKCSTATILSIISIILSILFVLGSVFVLFMAANLFR